MARVINQVDGLLAKAIKPGSKILPQTGAENILITSALPYCNNVPHLGNIIGSTLSADVYARYNRTRNRRVLYICGTDEYGTATETQALKEHITPKELCDKYHVLHKETYEWFEIGFDHFGRTSSPEHTKICQTVYLQLMKNGLLEKQTKDQTFCVEDDKFLADRFVEGTCPNCGYIDARGDQCDNCSKTLDAIDLINPRCLINSSHHVVAKPSTHMYVQLGKVQPKLEEWIKKSWKEGKWSTNSVINSEGELVDSRLKGGLKGSPITRDLKWGVPVPVEKGDPDGMGSKVLYVWFDAPLGYPSITNQFMPEWEQWWFNKDVKLCQFMGKDNVYFHTVYFPGYLIGDGRPWTMLHHLSTTEYLQYEGGKFSKSRGVGVFGPSAKETGIPAPVWRYYLISNRPETGDAQFSWGEFITGNNNVLLNNFGNFVNRALKFAASKYNSTVPESSDAPGPIPPTSSAPDPDPTFFSEINAHLSDYTEAMDCSKLRLGLQIVMLVSARGNLYLQRCGLSNTLFENDPQTCATVISRAINLIWVLSVLAHPFMPSTSDAILDQLNAPARTVPEKFSNDILAGHHLGKPEHLFKKIDEKMEGVWRAKFGGTQEEQAAKAAAEAAPLSKKKAAAAKKAAVATKGLSDLPKSTEEVALEKQIEEQAARVRVLKLDGTKGSELDVAVAELLSRKQALETVRKHGIDLTPLA